MCGRCPRHVGPLPAAGRSMPVRRRAGPVRAGAFRRAGARRSRASAAAPSILRPAADPWFRAASGGGRPAAGRRARGRRSAGARRGARRVRPGYGPASPGPGARRRAVGARGREERGCRPGRRRARPPGPSRASGVGVQQPGVQPTDAGPTGVQPTAGAAPPRAPPERGKRSWGKRSRGKRSRAWPFPPPAAGPRAGQGLAVPLGPGTRSRPGRAGRRGPHAWAVPAGACPGQAVRDARQTPGPVRVPAGRRRAGAPRHPGGGFPSHRVRPFVQPGRSSHRVRPSGQQGWTARWFLASRRPRDDAEPPPAGGRRSEPARCGAGGPGRAARRWRVRCRPRPPGSPERPTAGHRPRKPPEPGPRAPDPTRPGRSRHADRHRIRCRHQAARPAAARRRTPGPGRRSTWAVPATAPAPAGRRRRAGAGVFRRPRDGRCPAA